MADQQKRIIAGLCVIIEFRDNSIADLQQQVEAAKKETNLWKLRVDEAGDYINDYEEIQAELAAVTDALEKIKKCCPCQNYACEMAYKIATAALPKPESPHFNKAFVEKTKQAALAAKLKEFARCVISDVVWGYETMDGCDMQDFAERLGLIAEHTATKADVGDGEVDFEVGDKIYKFTAALAPCETCGGEKILECENCCSPCFPKECNDCRRTPKDCPACTDKETE